MQTQTSVFGFLMKYHSSSKSAKEIQHILEVHKLRSMCLSKQYEAEGHILRVWQTWMCIVVILHAM